MLSELFRLGSNPKLKKTEYLLVSFVGLFLFLVLWWFTCLTGVISPKILPNPISVFLSGIELFSEFNLLDNTLFSIRLNFTSYIYALLTAIPLGFIIGLYPIGNILVGRYINSIRYLPIPAITGLFIAIFGLTFSMKVSFLSFGLFIYILPAVVSKIQVLNNENSDEHIYLQTIKTLGATSWQKFRYVYFPYVMREISQEIINLTAISWSYVVISELIYKSGSDINGIGSLIYTLTRMGRIDAVYFCLFFVILIGVLQDIILNKLDKFIFKSKYKK